LNRAGLIVRARRHEGGFICSASYKGVATGQEVLDVTAGTMPIRSLFSFGPVVRVCSTTFVQALAHCGERAQNKKPSRLSAWSAAVRHRAAGAAQLLSYTLYRWENNIRAAAVLGVVGAGGLGQLLAFHMGLFHMDKTCTVILAMLALVARVCRQLLGAYADGPLKKCSGGQPRVLREHGPARLIDARRQPTAVSACSAA
jgi:hypothetical protein